MHLVIYGTESDGHLTINVDGVRCRLRRMDTGGWLASNPAALAQIREKCAAELASTLGMLATAEASGVGS